MSNTPEWALEKIREVKEKQLKRLDLSSSFGAKNYDKLSQIPIEVFELDKLEELNLKNNKLLSRSLTS